jgi:hypothetical protein
MADLKYIGRVELIEALAQHQSVLSPHGLGRHANLAFHDLTGEDFSYRNLSTANFSGASMQRAILTHANFGRATLLGAEPGGQAALAGLAALADFAVFVLVLPAMLAAFAALSDVPSLLGAVAAGGEILPYEAFLHLPEDDLPDVYLRRPGTMVGGKGNKAGQNDPCSRPFGRLGENPAPNLIEFHGSTPAHFEHR